MVRIQDDRGQYVVTSGPYAFVRHPGYAAGILIMLASVVVAGLPFLLYRAITEDRVLLTDLAGYRDYAARVRWRLLPGLW